MSSATAPSQREKQRADTHERIFQAAFDEFLRVGFANAQIPRIAAAAGVVRGTFYFHFPSKEHVLFELAHRTQARLAADLAMLRGGESSVRELLAHLIDALLDVRESLGGNVLLRDVLSMYVRAPLDGELDDRPVAVLEELTHHLMRATARGELRRDVEPERLAATVLTSVFGVLIARRADEDDLRPVLEVLAKVLLEGMRPPLDATH